MTRTICALVGIAVGSLITPPPALAVDGQVAITHAKAMAGNVTPGDVPGYPVSINLPGSYVLSSGLTVPDANTDAIVINADHVTVDLNGFAILGPTDCSGGLAPCANAGTGVGISTLGADTGAAYFNITIRGGTIQGMGAMGVRLRGDSLLVEYLHVRSNGKGGVHVVSSADLGGSIVQHNTVQRNGSTGIDLTAGIVAYNTVNTNYGGISVIYGTVQHNFVNRNGFFGLNLAASVNYIGNVMTQNETDVSLGRNQGQNLCGTTTCPGAQF